MFFLDPAGNALEFEAFADLNQLFAKQPLNLLDRAPITRKTAAGRSPLP